MTRSEAFETLGLPEGSDWGQVQSAHRRRSATRAGSRLDEAFFVLRRELTRGAWTPGPPALVTASRRPPRRGPARALAAGFALAAAVIAWRTLRPEAAVLPQAAAPTPAPAVLDSPSSTAPGILPTGAVSYTVGFERETAVTSLAGDATLMRAADTAHYYPFDDMVLVGYASSDEARAKTLARARAERAAADLVQKHGMDLTHLHIYSKVVNAPAAKVEVYVIAEM